MKMNLKDKCYKTKDDKLHETIFSRPVNISQERWEEIFGITEDQRIEMVKAWRAEKKNLVENKDTNKSARVSTWNPEWTVLSTGRRMSKRELKNYCKTHGKVWENE